MNFESDFFAILSLIGGIFTIVGIIMYLFPPRKINFLYGYRTSNSMKSKERWDFAQRYSALLMIKIGLAMCVLSSLGLFITISEDFDFYLAMLLLLISIVLLFLKTEKAIKLNFKEI